MNSTFILFGSVWCCLVFMYSVWVGKQIHKVRFNDFIRLSFVHNGVMFSIGMFLHVYGKFHSFW